MYVKNRRFRYKKIFVFSIIPFANSSRQCSKKENAVSFESRFLYFLFFLLYNAIITREEKTMKKINEHEIIERYVNSRSGMYDWKMPSKTSEPSHRPSRFAFAGILKLCGIEK